MGKERKAFTLIELLVVVLIIGILASIAIPQYFKVVEKARVAEAMSLIAAIKSAQERFMAKGGTYTSDFTKLDISYPGITASAVTTKFFTGSVAAASCSNGPCYLMTVTRHTNNSTVASRYGAYAINTNVPNRPQVQIGACPGGTGKCNELVE